MGRSRLARLGLGGSALARGRLAGLGLGLCSRLSRLGLSGSALGRSRLARLGLGGSALGRSRLTRLGLGCGSSLARLGLGYRSLLTRNCGCSVLARNCLRVRLLRLRVGDDPAGRWRRLGLVVLAVPANLVDADLAELLALVLILLRENKPDFLGTATLRVAHSGTLGGAVVGGLADAAIRHLVVELHARV